MENKIIWEGSEDDLTAKVGEYTLEVYRNFPHSQYWHWSLLEGVKYRTLIIGYSFMESQSAAKEAAEQALINHLNK